MARIIPSAPESLESVGVGVWDSIVAVYDLRPDELLTLEDICGVSDTLAALHTLWRDAGCPTISTGSMGQEVEHPLIGSIDKHRKTRNALWRQLKLPDLGESGAKPNQQRDAAMSGWAQAHGKGA